MEVREISREDHLAYIQGRPSVSFLQTPAWGDVKSDWRAKSLGWFNDAELVGAGLLLTRKLPKLNKFLGYLPEGPDISWSDSTVSKNALSALVKFAKSQNIFQLKIGPHVWVRRWNCETIKTAIATGTAKNISALTADDLNSDADLLITQLKTAGWSQPEGGSEFGDFQPRFVFQLDLLGKSDDELLSGFNQLWRRNIKKAQNSQVRVRIGTFEDLPMFHECYVETAKRDGFNPRPLSYFEHMYKSLKAEAPERIELFIAEHEDHFGAIAATTMTRVGNHAWYSYGASTTAARDLRPSNAIQWYMIQHAKNSGAATYDMRGIADTLDPEHHLYGLIQFKVGTGGYVQEYVGEWDFFVSPILARLFNFYLNRRR